ncbi:hypothetical protein Vafri_12858 [Volvox africanus]|uniref:F-box domain-containing protein n=2 Tax=Volvox africanus TaxID=51714 RepID=A0A8J4BBR6_9CHLO|nr:hypothetical protein Vafri_12858 [Volvox africanus]
MTLHVLPVEGLFGLHRPWLSLYGNRLQVPSTVSEKETELALIQRSIPNELMVIILGFLEPYSLGKAALVCRQWRILSEHPRLWEHACNEALSLSIPDRGERQKLMATKYRFSWKRMFIHHPHLRFDGLYAARNTYVRTGVVEFTNHKPVHLVSYFRYYRFLPDGTFLYRTSPHVVSKVAKSMAQLPFPVPCAGSGSAAGQCAAVKLPRNRGPGGPGGGKEWQAADKDRAAVLWGHYVVKGNKVHCTLVYPNSTSTELHCHLAMWSTHPGANNRLAIESIITRDRELGSTAELVPQQEPNADEDAPSVKSHSRGLAPCVFVPWEQVHISPLNKPSHEMDFMIV